MTANPAVSASSSASSFSGGEEATSLLAVGSQGEFGMPTSAEFAYTLLSGHEEALEMRAELLGKRSPR